MLLLLEPYLTPRLHYRVSLLAPRTKELVPQMRIDHAIQVTKVNQAEYRYLNCEPRRLLIVGTGIAGQRHHTMSRHQQHGGATSQLDFLLYQCRDQDRILSSQTLGATPKRTIVGRHLRIALREKGTECSARPQETTRS
jgi:hypothetical protein